MADHAIDGVANVARLEYRNFWYNGDRPSSDDVRFRERIEFKIAFNRPTLASDGVWYGIANVEWFVPLNGDVSVDANMLNFRVRWFF